MNLGILVPNLAASQRSFYLINYANLYREHDTVVFFETPCIPCIDIGFSIMQLHEAWVYNGPLIATTLDLTDKMVKFPGTKEKYFYVWDLEWTRIHNKNYSQLYKIYNSCKLIARSEEHARIIADCWNVPVYGIVNNFEIQEFINIINAERTKQGIPTQ